MPRNVTLFACLTMMAGSVAYASPSPEPAPESQGPELKLGKPGDGEAVSVQLVGLLVNGVDHHRELAVLSGGSGDIRVAVGMFCDALGLPTQRNAEGWTVTTPIGVGRLGSAILTRREQIDYVAIETIESALGVSVTFDSAELALKASVSWLAASQPTVQESHSADAHIDIHAPRASLSELRTDIQARNTQQGTDIITMTDVGGMLGPGSWRLRYHDDFEGRRSVDEWGWLIDRGRDRWYLGEQQVTLDSLLPSLALTGAQWAHTNRPDAIFGNDIVGNQLIASRLSARRVIQGEGPPGGIAELRINGQVIARTVVMLDGHFRFPEQNALTAGSVLEVALYRPASNDVPVRVYQVTNQASDELMPEGSYVVHAGFGQQDNPLDPNAVAEGGAGFATTRVGVLPRLTLDGSALRAYGQTFTAAGATADLGRVGTWTTRLAQSNNAMAVGLLGEGHADHAFWSASLRRFEAGYLDDETPMRHDYLMEAGWQRPRLRLSLIGRDIVDPALGTKRYLKPSLAAQPLQSVSISAFPDYNGKYVYAANWQASERTRFSLASYDQRRQLDWQQTVTPNYTLTTAIVDDHSLGSRQSSVLYRRPDTRDGIAWGVGVLHGNSRFGYLVDAGMELRPGLMARLQVQNDPLYTTSSGSSRLINLAISADFAVAAGGLSRGSFNPEHRRIGAIIAHIDPSTIPDSIKVSTLAGVGILVDGQVRTVLDEFGSARIDGVPPGVHQVSLDLENLPLELTPLEGPRNVEVRAGSATGVAFHLSHTTGCAGRVAIEAAGWTIRAVDGQAKVLATGTVNSIGYYRLDGLMPASYQLELVDLQGRVRATREVILLDSFQMDVDLSISISQPETTP
ncbi:MAG: hypothetical protein ABI411_08455 [Tahibacter sp.]